jgi:MoxR-like ATPase
MDTWKVVESVLGVSRRVLLYGPPATGKTWAGMKHNTNGRKVYSITVTPDMSMAELRGHYVPKGNEFIWKDGVAVLAWKFGARLVINEIADASEDVLVFLHAVLDDPDFAEYTLPTGSTVKPNDNFQVVATTNRKPEDLPEALRDRFPVSIEVQKPNPEALASLPTDIRKAASVVTDKPDRKVTIRMWNEFISLSKKIGEEIASEAVFGKRAKDILSALKVAREGL